MKWAKAFILSYLAIVVGITLSIVPEYDTKAALLTMTAAVTFLVTLLVRWTQRIGQVAKIVNCS